MIDDFIKNALKVLAILAAIWLALLCFLPAWFMFFFTKAAMVLGVIAFFCWFVVSLVRGPIEYLQKRKIERELKYAEVKAAQANAMKIAAEAEKTMAQAEDTRAKKDCEILKQDGKAYLVNYQTGVAQLINKSDDAEAQQPGEKRPYVIKKKMDIEDVLEHLPNCPSVIESFKKTGVKIRMMMLGASGSGKTVTMAMLMSMFGADPNTKYKWITPKGRRELFFPPNVNVEVRGGGESKEHVIDAKNALIEAIEIGKSRGGLSRAALSREDFMIIGVDEIKKFGLLFERYFGKSAKDEFTGLWLDLACFGRSQNLAIWIINQSGTVKDLGLEGSGQNRDNFNVTMRQIWDFLEDVRYCIVESPGRYPTMYRAPTIEEAAAIGIDCSTDPPTYVGGSYQGSWGHGVPGDDDIDVEPDSDDLKAPHAPPAPHAPLALPLKNITKKHYKRDPEIMNAVRRGARSIIEICKVIGLSPGGGNNNKVKKSLGRYGFEIEYDDDNQPTFIQNGRWED